MPKAERAATARGMVPRPRPIRIARRSNSAVKRAGRRVCPKVGAGFVESCALFAPLRSDVKSRYILDNDLGELSREVTGFLGFYSDRRLKLEKRLVTQ